jgi:hypothetical protein
VCVSLMWGVRVGDLCGLLTVQVVTIIGGLVTAVAVMGRIAKNKSLKESWR